MSFKGGMSPLFIDGNKLPVGLNIEEEKLIALEARMTFGASKHSLSSSSFGFGTSSAVVNVTNKDDNVCVQDNDLNHTDVNEKKRKFIVSPPPMSSSQSSINKRQRLTNERGNIDVLKDDNGLNSGGKRKNTLPKRYESTIESKGPRKMAKPNSTNKPPLHLTKVSSSKSAFSFSGGSNNNINGTSGCGGGNSIASNAATVIVNLDETSSQSNISTTSNPADRSKRITSYFSPQGLLEASKKINESPKFFTGTVKNIVIEPSKENSPKNNEQVALLQSKLIGAQKTNIDKDDKILNLENYLETSNRRCENLQADLLRLNSEMTKKTEEVMKIMTELLRESCRRETIERSRKLATDTFRLGQITFQRRLHGVEEVWSKGEAFRTLKVNLDSIGEMLSMLDEERKKVRKLKSSKSKRKSISSTLDMPPPPPRHDGTLVDENYAPTEVIDPEELIKIKMTKLKSEQSALLLEQSVLDREAKLYFRESNRMKSQEASSFNNQQILNERYLLLDLLGKGGFSEVWRCFDLIQLQYVACKIHQLSDQWMEAQKREYIRHATREYAIHKGLKHSNVVRLFDVFEIDGNSFATILEICNGTDLDRYLKEHKIMSERDSKPVLYQIVSALHYLNTGDAFVEKSEGNNRPGKRKRIIHYDLKPANILFDEDGGVKITDFGLSKVIDEDSKGMELTSQGAGTYWYLPPECFVTGQAAPPKISNKVDVWSVGVIYYQMLFGIRPFGEGMSQQRMYKAGTILDAKMVDFPSKPSVSQEAKDFIRMCLSYRQEDRPDVLQMAELPYLHKGLSLK